MCVAINIHTSRKGCASWTRAYLNQKSCIFYSIHSIILFLFFFISIKPFIALTLIKTTHNLIHHQIIILQIHEKGSLFVSIFINKVTCLNTFKDNSQLETNQNPRNPKRRMLQISDQKITHRLHMFRSFLTSVTLKHTQQSMSDSFI